MVAEAAPFEQPQGTLLGHPRGLFVLFFTELWERFSFYGMKALLILYLTKHLLFGDQSAAMIYGSYASLVYAMPVLGGLIADRYLGLRRAVTLGALLLVCGHFGMAIEGAPAVQSADGAVARDALHTQIFYLSLAFIIVGVGFLKPNISTLVGRLYGPADPRRDAAFTIFYMGINLGSLVATLACAYLGETYGWRYGFGLAGIGMLAGLTTFLRGHRHLQGLGEPPDADLLRMPILPGLNRLGLIGLGTVLALLVCWQLLQFTAEWGLLLSGFGVLVVGGLCWYALVECTPLERNRMLVMLLLMGVSVLFWALFEQAGSTLTLFADRHIDMGQFVTAGMFQSVNPLLIVLLAPLFAWGWTRLAQAGWEPSVTAKFGLAIIQVGLGFAVLAYGTTQAGQDGRVGMVWLVLLYLLHTTGELCLSPVGLSMVTRLAVSRVAAMMMGVWFLSSSFAAYVAGLIAAGAATSDIPSSQADAATSLGIYLQVFSELAVLALAVGAAVLLLARVLRSLLADG